MYCIYACGALLTSCLMCCAHNKIKIFHTTFIHQGQPSVVLFLWIFLLILRLQLDVVDFTRYHKRHIQCWKFRTQVILVYLQPFWRNSLLECVSQPEIAKNSPKPAILEVRGYSRSSMLTFLKSSSSVLVIISSMSVPICNHFQARGAYSGKITSF